MSIKIVTFALVGVASVVSLNVGAETQLLEYYCADKGAVSDEVVSVLSGQRTVTLLGERLQSPSLGTVSEPMYLLDAVNQSLAVTKECDQYALMRYQQTPEARVTFDFNRSGLHPSAQLVINKVAGEKRTFIISGHTDSVGSDDYNMALGQKRAEQVVSYLKDSGVPNDQMMAKSYGELLPVKSNQTTQGRAENRRVDISFSE